jgi:hypothetical protein
LKIVAFAQLNNELKKQNLTNWFMCVSEFCDYIYIYDQNSTDDSKNLYEKYSARVIYSKINNFQNEILCKQELLNLVKLEVPDFDWIFWMDGDTVVEKKLISQKGKLLKNLCEKFSNYDAISFGHINLWRSDKYYRIDDKYDWLDHHGVVALWKNNLNLSFANEPNKLHAKQYPNGIEKICKVEYKLIHRGFATDSQIIERYKIYKERGQSGWALTRLIEEKMLQVVKLDDEMLPNFMPSSDINPKKLHKITTILNENKFKTKLKKWLMLK